MISANKPSTALANLPSGYRPLDYVDTDGNQWVNTLFRPTCTNAVEIKTKLLCHIVPVYSEVHAAVKPATAQPC